MTDSVLFVLPGLAFGGAERLAANVLKFLHDRGVAVSAASLPRKMGTPDSAAAWFEPVCPVERIPRGEGVGRALATLVERQDASVLVLCGRSPAYGALPQILARRPGLRVVSFLFNPRQLVRENRQMAPYLDTVIAENLDAARALVAGDENRVPVTVVASGVWVEALAARSRPAASDRLTVGFVGRFDRTKNPRDFLRVARLLGYQNYRFVMAGAPRRGFRVPPGIDYRGLLLGEDLERFIDAIDILVVPSLNEGRSLACQEALARGLAVVASNVGGIPEVIEDGVTGILCPVGDVEAFAAAVRRLAADPMLRRRLGSAGQARMLQEGGARVALPRYAEVILGRPLTEAAA